MIYLIGGAPRVGKSIVAKILASKIGANPVFTDDLVTTIEQALSEEEKMRRFPWQGFSGDPSENKVTPTERVAWQEICMKSFQPEMQRLIDGALKDNHHLVLEGIHLHPDAVRKLIESAEPDHVQVIFIGSVDVERVLDGMSKNDNSNDWLQGSDEVVFRQVAEYVVAQSEWFKEASERNQLSYFERTDDFQKDIEKIVSGLLSVSS